MLKPLTKEQTDRILSIAAEEFADRGFAGTAVGSIAKRPVSVSALSTSTMRVRKLFLMHASARASIPWKKYSI